MLQILSFHNTKGDEVNDTTEAGDSSVLLPVLNGNRRAIAEAEAARELVRGRVDAALEAMSQGLEDKPWCTGNHFTLADVAVGCALGYLDFRFSDMDWRTARPRLSGWFEEFSQRASLQRTMPSA